MPAPLDVSVLRAQAGSGALPAVFSDIVRTGARRPMAAVAAAAPGGQSLTRTLAGLPEADRGKAVLDLVRAQAAAVLGHPSPEAVPPGRAFRDLGFDSLTAVELRNRLAAATGLKLPATLVFDYPAPAVLARHLAARLAGLPRPLVPAVAAAAGPAGEPIAIIGMSCRFPGGADSPEELWELLDGGRRCDRRVPGGPGLGYRGAV